MRASDRVALVVGRKYKETVVFILTQSCRIKQKFQPLNREGKKRLASSTYGHTPSFIGKSWIKALPPQEKEASPDETMPPSIFMHSPGPGCILRSMTLHWALSLASWWCHLLQEETPVEMHPSPHQSGHLDSWSGSSVDLLSSELQPVPNSIQVRMRLRQ